MKKIIFELIFLEKNFGISIFFQVTFNFLYPSYDLYYVYDRDILNQIKQRTRL